MLARHCRREPSHLHDPPWLNYTCHPQLFSFFKSAIVIDKIRDKCNKRQRKILRSPILPSSSFMKQIVGSIMCKEYREAHGFSDLLYSMNTTWSRHWAFHWTYYIIWIPKMWIVYILYIYIYEYSKTKNTADNNVPFLFRN